MPGAYGIAYTSYVVRMLDGRDIMAGTAAALPAGTLIELCAGAGAAGCQIDLSQLDPSDLAHLRQLRDAADRRGLFVELSVPAAGLEVGKPFDLVAGAAHALGADTLRVALLMGRRYESFRSLADWQAFAERARTTLHAIAPSLERAGLRLGVENHKDFLAGELAGLLARVGSPAVGACVDFGNNLSLLEDPMTVVETLAPWAVTTHLKDMAVQATGDGFDLSEVPLGEGMLPLAGMIAAVRRARPEVKFLLEMITRDPLPIRYRLDAYWITRPAADRPEAERQEAERRAARWLERAHHGRLPRTAGLTAADALALEDEHVRRCTRHATTVLGL